MADDSDMNNCGPYCGISPEFDVQPRVFVRRLGGEYIEIIGVQSFERDDDNDGGKITFGMADGQEESLNAIFQGSADRYVDVKMEFSIGMVMVMVFSGILESISGNAVSIAVATPISTDVLENAGSETLH